MKEEYLNYTLLTNNSYIPKISKNVELQNLWNFNTDIKFNLTNYSPAPY